jgi:3-mercaptopyruvate sulfurtransferase SseA
MQLQKFLYFLLLVAGTLTACTSIAQKSSNLSVTDFAKRIKQKNVQVLDVRTPGEYQSGYIKNSLLADWMN